MTSTWAKIIFYELDTIFTRCQGIKLTVEEYNHICQLLDKAKIEVLFPATLEDRENAK